MIPVRIPWTKQPPAGTEINWSHPLLRDVQLLSSSHRGFVYDEVHKEMATADSGGAGMALTDFGYVTDSPIDTTQYAWEYPKHDSDLSGGDALTIFALAKNRKTSIGATGNEGVISHDGSGNDPYTVLWQNSENFYVGVYAGGGNSAIITDGLSNGQTPANQWNALGLTWGRDSLVGRINNVKSSPTATSGTMAVDNNSQNRPRIGHDNGTGSWDGWVGLAIVWTRELSDAEWDSLVDNPWQIFEPRTVWIPVEVSETTTVLITSVDVNDAWADGATGLVIVGSGFQ